MKGAAVALLSFALAGCAPAMRATPVTVPASPVSHWSYGAEEAANAPPAAATIGNGDEATSEVGGEAAIARARAAIYAQREAAMGGFAPEVVHEARIEMAREALVEENLGKERMDVAEELERELAALQATDQTSKSRVRHAASTKKQP